LGYFAPDDSFAISAPYRPAALAAWSPPEPKHPTLVVVVAMMFDVTLEFIGAVFSEEQFFGLDAL
jgi:hypothetical protein